MKKLHGNSKTDFTFFESWSSVDMNMICGGIQEKPDENSMDHRETRCNRLYIYMYNHVQQKGYKRNKKSKK